MGLHRVRGSTKTEFKNVYRQELVSSGKYVKVWFHYRIEFNRMILKSGQRSFETARAAAIALDKKLLEMNLQPINILKRK